MDRDKLIGIIIKKQTYKNAKPVQADIQKKKEQAVNVSISAITHILKDDYNAEAKLYAIRFLKDCFEKGNESFISKTEAKILPILVTVVKDTGDENSIMKYGGSYTKKTELEKFKSFVTSFFTMSRECIEKWADWIPDPQRGFVKAQKAVQSCSPNPRDKGFVYFRPEQQIIFRQNCTKNGIVLATISNKNVPPKKDLPQNQIPTKIEKAPSKLVTPKPEQSNMKPSPSMLSNRSNCKAVRKIEKILQQANQKMNFKTLSDRQMEEIEGKFNAAINQYIEQADPFDEHFLEEKLEEFENLKIMNKQPKNAMGDIKIEEKPIQKQAQAKPQKEKIPSKQSSLNAKVNEVPIPKEENIMKQVASSKRQKPSFKDLNSQANQIPPSINPHTMNQHKGQESSKKSQSKKMKNQSRVNFEQSDSDYSDEERDLMEKVRKNNQSQSSTAKFIQDEVSSFQRKKEEGELASFKPQKKESSRIQFNNTVTESKLKSSLPDAQEIERLRRENEQNRKQKSQLQHKMNSLQRDMNLLKEEERKLLSKMSHTVQSSEVEHLKKELSLEKEEKNALNQQIMELRSELRNLQTRFEKSNDEWKNMSSLNPSNLHPYSQVENSRASYKARKIKKSLVQESSIENPDRIDLLAGAAEPSAPYSPRVDQDYVNNLTHFSKIASWMNDKNVLRFKNAVLGRSQTFYEDSNIQISKLDYLFMEDEEDFLKITFSFKFRRYQGSKPKVTFKNIPEVDLWVKPLSGKEETFTQQTLSRICMIPIKLIKASIVFDDGNNTLTFLVPFMYFNYLKPVEFDSAQFQEVFAQKYEGIIKSKVFRFNESLAGNNHELKNVFKESVVRKSSFIQMCLSEESKQRIFMVQIQVLRNQKGVLRVQIQLLQILPIPGNENMATRGKQLLNNLLFLLSQ